MKNSIRLGGEYIYKGTGERWRVIAIDRDSINDVTIRNEPNGLNSSYLLKFLTDPSTWEDTGETFAPLKISGDWR